jgi:FixJ family two-component response regulator
MGCAVTAPARGLVLVAEDDDSMREASERLLNAAGYESRVFATAEALLADALHSPANCVVSDYMLPGMSGLALLEALRARGRQEPMVLVTAYDKPALRAEAQRLGVAAFLGKPFRGTLLLEAIEAAIGPIATP